MISQLVTLILDESKWLTASMSLALLVVVLVLYQNRRSGLSSRHLVLTAMSLFFGITIGTMAFGHLLAVTVKVALGTLENKILLYYLIGIALAVPSWWLILQSRKRLTADAKHGRSTLVLNAWLAATLLALGFHNLPLAFPGFLNIGYYLYSRGLVGWAIVGVAVVTNVGLFVGSLIFLASGQSFEEFRNIQ